MTIYLSIPRQGEKVQSLKFAWHFQTCFARFRSYVLTMLVSEAPQKNLAEANLPAADEAPGKGLPPHPDQFVRRHIGPNPAEARQILGTLGLSSLDELVEKAVPAS